MIYNEHISPPIENNIFKVHCSSVSVFCMNVVNLSCLLSVSKNEFTLCVLSSDPKAETRLSVTVNGFEFHVYNRTDLYARLQETFGLEPKLITPKKDEERGREDRKKTLERSV